MVGVKEMEGEIVGWSEEGKEVGLVVTDTVGDIELSGVGSNVEGTIVGG